MSEATAPIGFSEKRVLGSFVIVDPESLQSGTKPNFAFHYIDISAATNGRLSIPGATIEYRDAPSRARRVIKTGDVIMSTVRPNLKAFAYCDLPPGNYIASTGFAVLRALGETDSRYVLYAILSDDVSRQINSLTVGSNYPAINSSDVRRLNIPVFAPAEQRCIAEILSTLDEAIEQTETLIAKMQQVKAGLIHDLFTRGVTPDGHLRPTREQAPDLYKESPLGLIPKEWDTVFLRDYVSLLKSGLSRRIEEQDIGIPVITSGNIKDGQFDRSELRYWYVNDPQGADTSKYTLDDKDILLNFINSVDQIGKLCIFRDIGRQCIYTTNLFRVKCSELTDQDFLYRILGSPHVQAEIKAITKPAINQASFTTGDLLRIRVQLIQPAEQSLICIALEQIDNSIVTQQQNLRKLELIKHGLMHDLLTGRVTVLSENCQ